MMLPDSRISSYTLHGFQDNPVSLETEALIFFGFSLLYSEANEKIIPQNMLLFRQLQKIVL
jgi:hypothetical protein